MSGATKAEKARLNARYANPGTQPEQPIPLIARRDLPAFPVDALPDPFAPMVRAVAEFTQTDPGMPGTSTLSVLAAAAGGRCEVEVRPGWREPVNLFTSTIADPGERKSGVQAEMTFPLLDAERHLVDNSAEIIAEAKATLDIAQKAANQAKTAASSAKGDNREQLTAEAISASLLAESIVVPAMPRLIADDVTPEAAASLLAEQKGRLAIVSAEGGIFDIIAGRYSGNIPHLDVFLKGHAGDTLKVDRKGRDPEYVERPALTVGLMVQPQVLTAIGTHPSFRGRGLLARFLYAIPPSRVGHRNVESALVPDQVRDRYRTTLRALAITLADWTDPAVLTLDGVATKEILEFARKVELQLGPRGNLHHIRDWGSKLVGATARIAGLLHLARHPGDGWRQSIDVDTVTAAIALADYFTDHALAAFDGMRANPDIADAEYLLDVIRRRNSTEVSKRDLHVASSRSRFAKVSDLDPAIRVLEDHGWLTPQEPPQVSGPGRRPSPRWTVNPTTETTQTTET